MNLAVFGAGASFGSDISDVPPLGNKLFDALTAFAPTTWGKLPEKYRKLFQNDFEQGMQTLSSEQNTWLPPLQRAMAAYFFNFLPQKSSLYFRIANLIKKSGWNLRGSLVTINYERMLPICLTANNLQPALGVEQIQGNQIEFCLPHGTCNLFCAGMQALGNIAFTGVSFDGGGVECIIDPIEFRQRLARDAIPPIMSYFEPQKSNSSGRSFIVKQRKRYQELVVSSLKIAIIGLKVRSFDAHIWSPLAQTNAEIIYCSGKQAGAEFLEWSKQNRDGKSNKILEGYFADCFDDICRELEIL